MLDPDKEKAHFPLYAFNNDGETLIRPFQSGFYVTALLNLVSLPFCAMITPSSMTAEITFKVFFDCLPPNNPLAAFFIVIGRFDPDGGYSEKPTKENGYFEFCIRDALNLTGDNTVVTFTTGSKLERRHTQHNTTFPRQPSTQSSTLSLNKFHWDKGQRLE